MEVADLYCVVLCTLQSLLYVLLQNVLEKLSKASVLHSKSVLHWISISRGHSRTWNTDQRSAGQGISRNFGTPKVYYRVHKHLALKSGTTLRYSVHSLISSVFKIWRELSLHLPLGAPSLALCIRPSDICIRKDVRGKNGVSLCYTYFM